MLSGNRFLVFDISNILYRTFFANTTADDLTLAGIAQHSALVTLNKYYKEYKPDKVIMVFDRPNWRKEYTQSDLCVSRKIYKGHRRAKMTPAQLQKYNLFLEHLADFENLMRKHTSVVVLAAEKIEADDFIAGIAQKYGVGDNEIIIVSSDKDLLQLLVSDHIRLINPENGKPRTLEEWDNDPKYFLFEKCFRGDLGDNVQSAYPKLRETKIKQAYTDNYLFVNLMNVTWKNKDGDEFKVEDLYEENRLLMDLTAQPESIRHKMDAEIEQSMVNPGKFSHFHFIKFCGKYQLKKISENVEQYVRMLSR